MGRAAIRGIGACVFDAYGTLFDFAAAARGCTALPRDKSDALTALWREKQLQYTWLRSLQGRHADFWRVTGEALDFALETLEIDDDGLRERLLNLYLALGAFPDATATLMRLKQAGMTTAILSNGSPAMLTAAVNGAGLGPWLDAVISAEEVGVYKPHLRVYQLAVDRLGLEAGMLLFLSANAWDAYAASAFGMRVVWCNRYRQRPERLPGMPDYEIETLTQLPALLAL